MIRDIVKDTFFLSAPCGPFTKDDLYIIDDLRDTLDHHKDICVGMAANMIGYRKRAVIVAAGDVNMILIEPVIVSFSGKYTANERCLSVDGEHSVTRYRDITVEYLDDKLRKQKRRFTDFIAQNIQHQIGHLNGELV